MQMLLKKHEHTVTATTRLIDLVKQFGVGATDRSELRPSDRQLLASLNQAVDAFLDEQPGSGDVAGLTAEIIAMSVAVDERLINNVVVEIPAVESASIRRTITAKCVALVAAIEAAEAARIDHLRSEAHERRRQEEEFDRLSTTDKVTFNLIAAMLELEEQRRSGGDGDADTLVALGRLLYVRLMRIGSTIPVNDLPAIAQRVRARKPA